MRHVRDSDRLLFLPRERARYHPNTGTHPLTTLETEWQVEGPTVRVKDHPRVVCTQPTGFRPKRCESTREEWLKDLRSRVTRRSPFPGGVEREGGPQKLPQGRRNLTMSVSRWSKKGVNWFPEVDWCPPENLVLAVVRPSPMTPQRSWGTFQKP